MRFSRNLWLAALGGLALAACGGGEDSGDGSVWHFRGVNLIADAPNLRFSIDGTVVENADYGSFTVFHPARAGARALQLAVRNPSDLTGTDQGYTDIGSSDSSQFDGPTDYTLVAAGTVAAPRKFIVSASNAAVTDHKVNYQVLNAAVDAGTLDVYITAPEGGIATPQSEGELDVGAASPGTEITVAAAAGAADTAARSVNFTVELRDGATVVYRSSALNVGENNRVLFVIADNVGPADIAHLKVLIVSGSNAAAATVAFDPEDSAELRFANVSPDAGALDLIESSTANTLTNVGFGAASAYVTVASDTINTTATPTGNPGSALFTKSFTAAPSTSYTLYAQGALAGIQGLPFPDNRRSITNAAQLRFLHAAPSEGGGAVDVYLKPAGVALDLSTTPPAPNVSALAYRAISSSLTVKPGTYDVYFARAGVKSTIAGPVPVTLAAAGVQTLALADNSALPTPLTLLPIDDARP